MTDKDICWEFKFNSHEMNDYYFVAVDSDLKPRVLGQVEEEEEDEDEEEDDEEDY